MSPEGDGMCPFYRQVRSFLQFSLGAPILAVFRSWERYGYSAQRREERVQDCAFLIKGGSAHILELVILCRNLLSCKKPVFVSSFQQLCQLMGGLHLLGLAERCCLDTDKEPTPRQIWTATPHKNG